ncbi:hypothetical protein COLO4_29351 [Corchorus olitorius]|uniref:Cullin N-terminal domain-containing protein n=1 Tax=Corchorus olitorius TaxID=93759 RepID=A0A1R3HF30_9ROSI|nr:hypothetical protein COLO4_29351 [Corchorus olitorius]
MPKFIEWEEGWGCMEHGIEKLIWILEGLPEPQFTPEEYINLYTIICSQNGTHDYSQLLYDKYQEVFKNYIDESVLPSIRNKYNEFMLRELVKQWANHQVMNRWLSRFFNYLDRYFIARRSLPTLLEVGKNCFRDWVYKVVHEKVREAVYLLELVEPAAFGLSLYHIVFC